MLPAAPSHPRRIVFLGTPEAAVPPLQALHRAGFVIPLVVSRADAKRGRGGALTPSPVKAAALDLQLPVTDELDAVREVDADLGVVVAYGRIIPVRVLERLPMVNLHFSLLPRWRGAAPVERAILAGDATTGVCLMQVEEGLDTGGVHRRVEVGIGADETADELRHRLSLLGSQLLVSALTEGLAAPTAQEGEPTYADKVTSDDRRLRWPEPADQLERVVRIGDAWTTFRDRRLKVWRASVVDGHEGVPGTFAGPGPGGGIIVATGRGGLELLEVQPEGKPRIEARSWVNGARPAPDEALGR